MAIAIEVFQGIFIAVTAAILVYESRGARTRQQEYVEKEKNMRMCQVGK
jgi:hypothetical protein